MNGPIHGGWEYVIAAYAAVWCVLGIYGVSLWRRLQRKNAL